MINLSKLDSCVTFLDSLYIINAAIMVSIGNKNLENTTRISLIIWITLSVLIQANPKY